MHLDYMYLVLFSITKKSIDYVVFLAQVCDLEISLMLNINYAESVHLNKHS